MRQGAVPAPWAGGALWRVSCGLSDQAAASLTTLCLSIGVLRGGAAGAVDFAVVFLIHTLAVGLSRSLTSEPVAQELPGTSLDRVRARVRAASVTGLGFGVVSALVSAVFVRPETSVGLCSLAFTVLVVPTDSIRSMWTGAGRAPRAAPISTAQLLAAAAGLVIAVLGGSPAWGLVLTAAVSLVAVVLSLGRGPRPGRSELRPAHWYYAAEWFLTSGLAQSTGLVVAAFGLPLIPLLLRAQGVVFGPVTTLTTAVALLVLPELVAHRSRWSSLVPAALGISALLVVLSAGYAIAVGLLPASVLRAALGGTAPAFATVLLPCAVSLVTACVLWGPMIALRALGAARASLVARIVIGVLSFALPLAGALLAGVQGFFWSTAVASVLSGVCAVAVLQWVESRKGRRVAPRAVDVASGTVP
ncbi:hypothetical protein DQ238_19960 [Geodermatophilus sp. TF02-6]|uniref:hypothetical protein n=1 Tax=Geodermatophilus sp. TF02-6 TaxID=2250575 RepID=UPI000DEB4250|nr:hypothetical protein [Geodermatophilus sp. TF02-6]RBY75303.1 hypothetical protein DQ238_19960 [Geodermatophilus sp. TF02-6]